MKLKSLIIIALSVNLTSCAYQMHMMPRDSGKIYKGAIQSNGMGSGTLNINIDSISCSGKFAKGRDGDSFGFFQTYGAKGANSGSFQSFGSSTYKVLMSCNNGTGIRCDVEGSETGTGICVDSNNKVFDMIYSH